MEKKIFLTSRNTLLTTAQSSSIFKKSSSWKQIKIWKQPPPERSSSVFILSGQNKFSQLPFRSTWIKINLLSLLWTPNQMFPKILSPQLQLRTLVSLSSKLLFLPWIFPPSLVLAEAKRTQCTGEIQMPRVVAGFSPPRSTHTGSSQDKAYTFLVT